MTTGQGAARRPVVIVGESAVTVGATPRPSIAHCARLIGESVGAVECIRTISPQLKGVVAGPLVLVADRHVTNCAGWAAA